MTNTAKAWLIDLDGTLYRAGWMKLAMAAELALTGPSCFASLKTFRHGHEELREELLANPLLEYIPTPFDEQLRRAAERNGQELEVLRVQVLKWMVRKPGKWMKLSIRHSLVEEIKHFRAQGGKTAVVSDYPAAPKLEAMGLSAFFDTVVASGEHPRLTRLKPSPDGFLLAASELGVVPADCLVIGDRDDADGEAARRANMAFRLVS